MNKKFAEVIVAITNKEVDRIFEYKIPDNLLSEVQIGMRVIVPFGGQNKKTEGFVIGFKEESEFDESKLKYILSIQEKFPIFTKEMLNLAKWMKDKYYTTLYACLKCIMPAGINMKSEYIISVLKNQKVSEKADQIIKYVLEHENKVAMTELIEEFGNVTSSINTLEKKEIITKNQLSLIKDYTLRVKYAFLNDEIENLSEIADELLEKKSPQGKVLKMLFENGSMTVSDLKSFLKISDSPIQTLEKNNLIFIDKVEIRRNIKSIDDNSYKKNLILTDEQVEALNFLKSKIAEKSSKPILLNGVTGSGKTEVYIKIIEETLKIGKQAIVLVPEISLTPQTVSRFVSRFGDKTGVTHSKLSAGERFDQWKRAYDSEIEIMIGPRSAIFTPFKNLGVIIIDEEHENSYISDSTPKYNTREVAAKLAEITGALVVFGSATPSIDSYYKAKENIFDLVVMKDRVNNSLPEVEIIDMRQELANGNRSIFSAELEKALHETVEKNEQAILFLNRRGYSTFVSCRNCGHVLKCEKCNVNYTYHIKNKKLVCHYCGKQEKNPTNCPICGSKYIKYFGVGTQKVEEEVKKLFPNENILRMDLDTVSKKHSHERILSEFREGKAKILIGTQMIAKGLDFPKVSLVGVIAADISLNNGDFRSGENTFQLLTQVSGRAGRSKIKGRVFIQTYNPEHYAISLVKSGDYENFYEHEISLRRQMVYPPFSNIFIILFSSENEKELIKILFKLMDIMNFFNRKDLFEMLGPSPAFISKIKNKYRWKILVKSVDEEKIKSFVFYCINKLKETENLYGITMNLTLNPTVSH